VNNSGSQSRRRVVVTGFGCATPLGLGVERTWNAAIEGHSGVRAITRFDASDYPVRFAGEVPDDLDLSDLPPKEARRLDRAIAMALVSANEAIAHANLVVDESNRERIGVAIGSGIGGLETLEKGAETVFKFGPRRVHPFMIPMAICNMASGYVAIRHIGEAGRAIERGDADVVVAGGCEAPVTRVGVAGFAAMRALSTRNDDVEAASRPFDRDRDGFVMGEGAGVVVLEAEEHARARGARSLGTLLGYAATCDAAHIAQPTEDAEGAQRCMRVALGNADLAPRDVDYLNAHATSTPMGDTSEVRAIRAVFGSHAEQLAVSATKSMTGHLLGAAGAVEAILTLRALQTGTNKARLRRIRVALSNSFGFGGTNATLVFGAAD